MVSKSRSAFVAVAFDLMQNFMCHASVDTLESSLRVGHQKQGKETTSAAKVERKQHIVSKEDL